MDDKNMDTHGRMADATGLGSAEAPEPHSGLRPTGAIPCAGPDLAGVPSRGLAVADTQGQDAGWLEGYREGLNLAYTLLAENERLRDALRWLSLFADVRSQDDGKTFARVNRGALRTIRDRASAALFEEVSRG